MCQCKDLQRGSRERNYYARNISKRSFLQKARHRPHSKHKSSMPSKAVHAAVPKTYKTFMPAKNTASTIILAKKTNVTLFSDKAIKKPKPFLPDVDERLQGLSGSNSTLSTLSRPCQALLLPTSTPLPHDLNYGLPPHPSSNLCRKPKQQSVTKSVLPRCITAQNVQNIKTHGKTPCEDPARQNLLKTTPRSTEKRRIDP